MRFAVRLFFTLLLFFVSAILVFKPLVFAQTTNNKSSLNPQMSASTNTDVPQNLHTYTQSAMIEVMASILCQLTGKDPINPAQECLGIDPGTGKIGFVPNQGGLIGMEKDMIVALYTPPLHSGEFFNYVAQNFGIAKTSYAQTTGTGFQSLSPLLSLWSAFRNIVYVVFVFIFIIIGVAIMLRVRIDPRTVMTIQNQIPKLVVGLLLITLSYAIAGFMVDMMYISSYIGISVISTADPLIAQNSPDIALQLLNSSNPINAINIATSNNNFCIAGSCGNVGLAGVVNGAAAAVGGFMAPLFASPPAVAIMSFVMGVIGATVASSGGSIVGTLLGLTAGIFAATITGGAALPLVIGIFAAASGGGNVGASVGSALGAIFGFTAGANVVAGFISIVAWLIIAITIIFSLFRLWFQLIMAYINIILDVIFAPFWILLGLVPGSKIGFSAWFRDLVANLAAFPATLIMFLLARIIIDSFGQTQTNVFVAPLIGNPSQLNEIASLIALGIILTTPEIVKITKSMLKAPNLPTEGARKELGVSGAALGFIGGSIWSRLYYRHVDYSNPEGGNPNYGKMVSGGIVGQNLSKVFRFRGPRLAGKAPNTGQKVNPPKKDGEGGGVL